MLAARRNLASNVTVKPGSRTLFILVKPFAESVSVNAEGNRRFGEVMVVTLDNIQDKSFLEFTDCFFIKNPLADHLVNEAFKCGFHDSSSVSSVL